MRLLRVLAIGSAAALAGCKTTPATNQLSGSDGGPACATLCSGELVCIAGQCLDPCVLAGELRCDGECIDPTGDSQNCGGCGLVCPGEKSCREATCAGSCPAGQTSCADAGCVDLEGDSQNCGQCGRACGASESCLTGSCQTAPCTSPLLACGTEATSSCIDPRNDPDNCGNCGVSCGVDGACMGGSCACFPRETNCGLDGGVFCPDLTSDPRNCGACGSACLRCEGCSASSCGVDGFQIGAILPLPGGNPHTTLYGLVGGDFNGDGLPDLVAIAIGGAYVDWQLVWWSGLPDGGFQAEPGFVPDSGLREVTARAVDFDGDGVDDLAILETGSGIARLSVLLGSRGSRFSTSFDALATDAGEAWDLAVGDVNGDGRPDIVVSASQPFPATAASLFINDGDGGFLFAGQIPFGGGERIGVADMNADGLADLVIGGEAGLAVDFQLSDGGFLAAPTNAAFVQNAVDAIDPYGHSGRQLLVTVPNGVELLVGSASGPQVVGATTIPPFAFLFSGSAVADLNGDGIPDVVSAGTNLGIFLRHGAGFDDAIPDGGLGGYVAVLPSDAGTRVATGDYSGGIGYSVAVSALPCP